MAYKDSREFLEKLKEKGMLKTVTTQVDWNEEVGAICQELMVSKGPAAHFVNIKDHQETWCKELVLDSVMSSLNRLKVAMDVPQSTTNDEIIERWRAAITRTIKPNLVSGGPCKEEIIKGDDIDLGQIPAPKYHRKDGGRYINTWSAIITKDPETGVVNVGNYRGMVADKDKIGVLVIPTQGWGVHYRKYLAMNKPMPVAIVNGADPVLHLCGVTPFPHYMCEYDVAGGVRGEPMDLTMCETTDLPVPAAAEIIIEGEIDPKILEKEGPFGEYNGYFVSMRSNLQPVVKVNCITHRKDPIYQGVMNGVVSPRYGSPYDSLLISHSAAMWDHMERTGVRGITGVWQIGSPLAMIVIRIKQQFYGHARQAAHALWSMPVSIMAGKWVIVVDDDVDIYDPHKVLIAVSNMVRPGEDLEIFHNTGGGTLDPSVHPDILERTGHIGSWDRVFIDATKPFDWKPREDWDGKKFPYHALAEEDMLEKVRKRWKEYDL